MSVQQLNLEVTSATSPLATAEGVRRGCFTVTNVLLEPSNIDLLKGLFDGMIVCHVEVSHYEGVTRYYAVHDDFEPSRLGEITPHYIVIVDRGGDEPRFFFERVTQESMV